jgi:hypothetical protein
MKHSYKGYDIEISASHEEGLWEASAKLSPLLGGIGTLTNLGPFSKGNFPTQEMAETAVLEWAKELIDNKSSAI